MKLALCLLTRNEHECLQQIFHSIPKPGPESGYDVIYAIDGNSTDGTQEFFKKNNVPVIVQGDRKGRGNAFHLAFEQIDSDGFIFFSPDGNEDVNDIKKFKPLLQAGAELVIASRMMKEAYNEEDHKIFKWRKWANNVFNLMVNFSFRSEKQAFVTDSINGFRGITKKAALQLNLDARDYTIEYQMTMRALQQKLTITEFPTIEGQRVAGATGAPSIPTGLRFIRCFAKEFRNFHS